MRIGRLPVTEQLDALRATLARNDVLLDILGRATTLDLPGWYLTAGCLVQTVWTWSPIGRPPTESRTTTCSTSMTPT
jgi:hypothetical protein